MTIVSFNLSGYSLVLQAVFLSSFSHSAWLDFFLHELLKTISDHFLPFYLTRKKLWLPRVKQITNFLVKICFRTEVSERRKLELTQLAAVQVSDIQVKEICRYSYSHTNWLQVYTSDLTPSLAMAKTLNRFWRIGRRCSLEHCLFVWRIRFRLLLSQMDIEVSEVFERDFV